MHQWSLIELALDTLVPATGGFSAARRGLVKLPDGEQVFVKIGTTESTKLAAKREVIIYKALAELQYSYIPKLIAVADNQESFALEVIEQSAGWNWGNEWCSERLVDTLEAIDILATLSIEASQFPIFNRVEDMMQVENGWLFFKNNKNKQQKLEQLLTELDQPLTFDVDAAIEASLSYVVKQDTLTHFDLRADNVAWHKDQRKVKIVDWNWACLGDKDLDMAAFLTHVACYNKEIVHAYTARLSAPALQYLAGFWLHYATEPLWEGGPEGLRPMQLALGLMAYDLSRVTLN